MFKTRAGQKAELEGRKAERGDVFLCRDTREKLWFDGAKWLAVNDDPEALKQARKDQAFKKAKQRSEIGG